MEHERINIYEGFFLFPQAAASDLQGAADHIKDLLARSGAEIISFAKWDERRLAYEIKGNKRGIYFLAYFHAPADNITSIERDSNLSEMLLRSMISRADHLTEEQIQAADGQAELADEIKLRDAEASAEPAPPAKPAPETPPTPPTPPAETKEAPAAAPGS